MASDAQQSGPLPGTGPAAKFTQGLWVTHFGADAGIVGDTDGTAFSLTLPPSTDVAEIGSATIDSVAKVGGFPLKIPEGTTQSLTIPASTNPTVGRTDLIVAQFNSGSFTTAPGPVRLVRIGGTEGSASLPSLDTELPSPVNLPLYAITRKQGLGLNQATVVDLRPRAGWNFLIPAGGTLPPAAPLGSRAVRDGIVWRRDFVSSAVDWVQEPPPITTLTGTAATATPAANWSRQVDTFMVRDGKRRQLHLVVNRAGTSLVANSQGGGFEDSLLTTLHDADKPAGSSPISMVGNVLVGADNGASYAAVGAVWPTGTVYLTWLTPTLTVASGNALRIDASWYVA